MQASPQSQTYWFTSSCSAGGACRILIKSNTPAPAGCTSIHTENMITQLSAVYLSWLFSFGSCGLYFDSYPSQASSNDVCS